MECIFPKQGILFRTEARATNFMAAEISMAVFQFSALHYWNSSTGAQMYSTVQTVNKDISGSQQKYMLQFYSLIYAVLSRCCSGIWRDYESCNTHFSFLGYLFVCLFIFPPAVQMEKMELMKKERLGNHPLCHCRPLPVKWSILMTGKKLMLLGNVRNVSFLQLEWLQPTSKTRLSGSIYQIS